MPLCARAESLAAELLVRGRHEPGRPLRQLAERLGYQVLERELPEGVRGWSARASATIVLSPAGYDPRDEFTLAHELAEMVAPRAWLDLPSEVKERMCDRLASALVLPGAAFKASVRELGLDLAALRRRWKRASWDVIARRLVDVKAARTAAVWDSLQLTWRYGGEQHPHEEEALGRAMDAGRGWIGGVRAWRITGEGVGRVAAIAA